MTHPILAVKNLAIEHRNFSLRGKSTFLLKEINFSLTANTSISIIGESGTGKTTLMNSLLGLHNYNRGEILFYGKEIRKLASHEKKKYHRSVQPVFQNYRYSFNSMVSLEKSLLIGFNRQMTRRQKREQLTEYLNLTGLEPGIIHKYPHQLSGGELQRLALVRALVSDPEILILDEPFSSLDIINEKKLLDVLLTIRTACGLSFIFITHKRPLVKYFNDRVYGIEANQFFRWKQYE
ncbi:MAG: ATP-binding cassette domain-containing protein [Fidelibacterota bacterium]